MKRSALLAIALAATVAAGCDSTNGQGGSGGSTGGALTGTQPTVDLAVSDPSTPMVAIYLNVLNFFNNGGLGFPSPDIILDDVSSGVGSPQGLYLTEDDLVVCDGQGGFVSGTDNDSVHIFRSYRDAVDGDPADAVFSDGGSIGNLLNPNICKVDEDEDVLLISASSSSEVKIVYDFSSIPDGVDPAVTSVTLNNAGSLVDFPVGIATAEGDLYVANANATSAGEPCVSIYRDISTLTDNQAPDVELDTDTSFIGAGGSTNCTAVMVGNNPFDSTDSDALYVSTVLGQVFVFEDAASLATNDLPDAVFFGPEAGLGIAPVEPLIAGDRLYVPNLTGGFFGPTCADAAGGVVGFSSIGSFNSAQERDFQLGADNGLLINSTHIDLAGGALFAAGSSDCLLITGSVWIFGNGQSVDSTFQPGLVIPGNIASIDNSFQFPLYLDARQRDLGT